MANVLYWNLYNFTLRRIVDPTNPVAAQGRLDFIIQRVFLQNVPDIFVVVEVYSRTADVVPPGTLVSGNAGSGVRRLLDEIRNATGNAAWSLVPPTTVGRQGWKEGVAVYYNAATVAFNGPWVYARLVANGIAQACAAGIAANYPPEWNGYLPPAVGGNPPFAAQWSYPGLNFPYPDSRAPFLTQFLEPPNQPNARTISLYVVHTTPQTAARTVPNLALLPFPAPPVLQGNDVVVLLGDFNVDSFGLNNAAYGALYGTVAAPNFTCLLDPRVPGQAAPNPARKPYSMTHLLPLAKATPYNTVRGISVTRNVYPRYGYMGSTDANGNLTDTGAIDNVFVKYAAGGGVPLAGGGTTPATVTIVNSVVGTPYAAAPAPPAVPVVTGPIIYPALIQPPIPAPRFVGQIVPGGFAGYAPAVGTAFQNSYFSTIRTTSDHLPLYATV